MRVTQSITYRNYLSDIEKLNEDSNKSVRELSSGKRLNTIRDSPSGSAQLLEIINGEAKIDRYTSNTNDSSFFLKVSDSTLNEVHNLITSAYTKGSQAGTETVTADTRAIIAEEIRSLRDQLLALANSQARGRYIFAGAQVEEVPFAILGDTVSYQGDGDVNRVRVDEGLQIEQGVAGSDVFDPIFSALEGLLAGMDGNSIDDIQNALGQVSLTLSGLGQIRAGIGSKIGMLENVQSNLDTRTINLREQKSRIEDADMAEAAVELKRTQTSLNAAITAGGTLLGRRNLFDIIG